MFEKFFGMFIKSEQPQIIKAHATTSQRDSVTEGEVEEATLEDLVAWFDEVAP